MRSEKNKEGIMSYKHTILIDAVNGFGYALFITGKGNSLELEIHIY